LNQITPHKKAGCLTLHPVSVPRAAGTSHAATAAAEPELEPPGILFIPQGLRVFQNAEFSQVVPIANSSIFVFPIELIHSFCNLSIIVASKGGLKFSSILEAPLVMIHFSEKISFTPRGSHFKIPSLAINHSLL